MLNPQSKLFHIEFHVFGAWLPGDIRGFRNHDHRIHSSGDYKSPPAQVSEHQALHQWMQQHLHKIPVKGLTLDQRQVVGDCLIQSLHAQKLDVFAMTVAANHVHILIRGDLDLDDATLRKAAGSAKRKSSHLLRSEVPGSLWQRKVGVFPVRNEQHLGMVMNYITEHEKQGAWVWCRDFQTCSDWRRNAV